MITSPGQTIKIGIIGQTKVGKTTFIQKTLKGSENPETQNTFILEVNKSRYECGDGSLIPIEMWDTSGRYEDRIKVQSSLFHFIQMDVIILMYDISENYTFQAIDRWNKQLKKKAINPKFIYLVGNKLDKVNASPRDRKVTELLAREKVANLGFFGADFKQISLINNSGQQLLEEIIEKVLHERFERNLKRSKLEIVIEEKKIEKSECEKCESCEIF